MSLVKAEIESKRQRLEEELLTARHAEEEAVRKQTRITAQLELLAELLASTEEAATTQEAKVQPLVAAGDRPKRSEADADLHVLAAAGALPNNEEEEPKKGRRRKHLGQEEIVALLPDLPSRFNYLDLQEVAKSAGHKYIEPAALRLKLNEMARVKPQRWFAVVTPGTSTTPNIFEKLPL
jgi:hypothetical protein